MSDAPKLHEYTLSDVAQRIVAAAREAPQWDATRDRLIIPTEMSDAPTQRTGIWSSSVHANHADNRDAEITLLRAKVEALAAALEFYADLSHEGPWHLPGEDYGKRARAALEQNKSET